MSLVWTTDAVPEGERLTYWRDALSRALVPMTVTARGDGPFSGRISSGRLGCLWISTVEADPQRASRTPAQIARAASDCVAVGVQTAGTATLLQDGRHARVGEGDLVVYDTSRPYALDYPGRFSTRVLHMPRRAVGLPEEDLRRVTGTALAGTEGAGALLVSFLTGLAASLPTCSPAVATRLAASVVDLFGTLVDERTTADAPAPADPHHPLVPRIRDHIDRHLADPGLSPASVAAAHHISVRYLHRLFEEEGVTVARLIRRLRLERCARDLTRRDPAAPTVSAVAQRWGFANPAHFSRVFRAAYGRSPRDWVRHGTVG
ncbi:helix-turn-helix domain-containing protein [Streptomyces griseoruber]|uniref:Transcriptional regulator n=1 Tax=Streptomyces griseoruber TaxID=1943 RepID=A0A101T5H1_9ACTN|nr:helix-turn-helix domain-containing protein [Streptomyces griseoruber]KUN86124.1 transcriptional regulator [Streptomyces griseoruber]